MHLSCCVSIKEIHTRVKIGGKGYPDDIRNLKKRRDKRNPAIRDGGRDNEVKEDKYCHKRGKRRAEVEKYYTPGKIEQKTGKITTITKSGRGGINLAVNIYDCRGYSHKRI